MLYITNIDDCNFSMYGDAIGIAGLKVYGKKNIAAKAHEPVYNELQGRVSVYNLFTKKRVVDTTTVDQIDLDGTVYATAQEFVVVFNNIMAECCCLEATTTLGLDGELLINEDEEIIVTNEDNQRITLNE